MTIILSCAIIRDQEGNFLMQLRDSDPGRNTWVLFGGHVEDGESERDAIVREIKEELDYDIKQLSFFKKYYDGKIEVPLWVVEEPVSMEYLTLHEGYEMRFFSKEDLLNLNLGFNFKEILNDYLRTL